MGDQKKQPSNTIVYQIKSQQTEDVSNYDPYQNKKKIEK